MSDRFGFKYTNNNTNTKTLITDYNKTISNDEVVQILNQLYNKVQTYERIFFINNDYRCKHQKSDDVLFYCTYYKEYIPLCLEYENNCFEEGTSFIERIKKKYFS